MYVFFFSICEKKKTENKNKIIKLKSERLWFCFVYFQLLDSVCTTHTVNITRFLFIPPKWFSDMRVRWTERKCNGMCTIRFFFLSSFFCVFCIDPTNVIFYAWIIDHHNKLLPAILTINMGAMWIFLTLFSPIRLPSSWILSEIFFYTHTIKPSKQPINQKSIVELVCHVCENTNTFIWNDKRILYILDNFWQLHLVYIDYDQKYSSNFDEKLFNVRIYFFF